MIKTFRGQLTDTSPGNQNQIRLQTIKGKVGYRIVKLELMGIQPGTVTQESTVKIFTSKATTIDSVINFTDSDLLAAGYYLNNAASDNNYELQVIFDREIFNQDIFITHYDNHGAVNVNYYLELEVIPLDDAGAEYTTLKDLRTS